MFQSRSYTQTSSNLKPAVSTDSTIDNGNVTTSIRLFVIPNGILPAFGSPQILENVFYLFGLTALAGKNLQVTLCRVFKGLNLIADVGTFMTVTLPMSFLRSTGLLNVKWPITECRQKLRIYI